MPMCSSRSMHDEEDHSAPRSSALILCGFNTWEQQGWKRAPFAAMSVSTQPRHRRTRGRAKQDERRRERLVSGML